MAEARHEQREIASSVLATTSAVALVATNFLDESKNREAALRANISVTHDNMNLHAKSVQRIENNMATAGAVEEVKSMLTHLVARDLSTKVNTTSARSPRPSPAWSKGQPRQSPSRKESALLRTFMTSACSLIEALVFAIPQLTLMLKVMRSLPPAVSLVLRDNILFEDALGRTHSLQFQQFRHWTVFEAYLRQIFRDLPGMRKVYDGDFLLRIATRWLNRGNWYRLVRPRQRITMAMLLKWCPSLHARGYCPGRYFMGRAVPMSYCHCRSRQCRPGCHKTRLRPTLDRKDPAIFEKQERGSATYQISDPGHEARYLEYAKKLQRLEEVEIPSFIIIAIDRADLRKCGAMKELNKQVLERNRLAETQRTIGRQRVFGK